MLCNLKRTDVFSQTKAEGDGRMGNRKHHRRGTERVKMAQKAACVVTVY